MFSCCSPPDTSASPVLEWYAQQLREMDMQRSFSVQLHEMYVVSYECLIKMTSIKPYEQLKENGSLVIFNPNEGNAMFISHQWAGLDHPDPTVEQFRVLQDSLKKVVSDASSINANVSMELYVGQKGDIPAEALLSRPLFIWYDYFCCPQDEGSLAQRNLAISSIPAFIEQSRFFVILCPNIRHSQNEALLNKRTWKERGWCRLEERFCRELSPQEGRNFTIEIFSATYQAVSANFDWLNSPVGEGQFSKEGDRGSLCPVLAAMVERRLRLHLESGEFHEYRVLLNLQRIQFRNLPLSAKYDFIPGFATDPLESKERWNDPAYATANFLYQNGFSDINQRIDGWTPICFASLNGDPMILQQLIDEKADVNDHLTEPYERFGFADNTTILSIAAYTNHNEAMKLLISRGADIHRADHFLAYPIHWGCISGNDQGVKLLLEAGSTKHAENILGLSPFSISCSAGEIECMKAILPHASPSELDAGLHAAILHAGGNAEVVSVLIEAHVDVNHQLKISPVSVFGALLMGLGLRHRWKESTLSLYAYHHYEATPLMCSILTGAYEVSALLLAAGARTDLRNYRQKTALDIAYETSAPDFVLSALKGQSDYCERLVKEYVDIATSRMTITEERI